MPAPELLQGAYPALAAASGLHQSAPQAANRHDAAVLAAQQQEVAALEAEAARLSSSNTAQAEHEARFRTAAERCAAAVPGPCASYTLRHPAAVQRGPQQWLGQCLWSKRQNVNGRRHISVAAARQAENSLCRAAEELAFMAHGISVQEVERTSMVVQIATHQGATVNGAALVLLLARPAFTAWYQSVTTRCGA
jgi:hypothetical protein